MVVIFSLPLKGSLTSELGISRVRPPFKKRGRKFKKMEDLKREELERGEKRRD